MLSDRHKKTLHEIAYQSIEQGLIDGREPVIDLAKFDQALCEKRSTFVTLKTHDKLRGCIGTLSPVRPLVEDVAHNAYAAAFHDSRFEPLNKTELAALSIHISILNSAEDMAFDSEQDLLRQLRPGIDGIILQENTRRATFLPSVWESIDSRAEFIHHLKLKAGLPKDYWSENMQIQRYTVDEF
ncbi:MAG: AmmeMemoRadiSam system protein A [Gammaproteobacteria bacterium]